MATTIRLYGPEVTELQRASERYAPDMLGDTTRVTTRATAYLDAGVRYQPSSHGYDNVRSADYQEIVVLG